ncbi:MAG: DUF1002 domain-containing protein [Oscillospiraceae bacterium]|nr:DUF1002 domain-containing protein [Oscillospiraceae bacterium]
MNGHMGRRPLAVALLVIFLLSSFTVSALADVEMRRVVIGADLTEEQIGSVYEMLGLRRGEIPELVLTNAEEHAYLEQYVDSTLLGTRSISCVYLEMLPQGSGLDVQTFNISWYTPDMYRTALETAGITDAKLMIAAPFSVSGTAALAGVYKAYEDMTGQKLVEQAKEAGTQELTVVGDLAEEIGSEESASIVGELKQILNETAEMTDEEIRLRISEIAKSYNVSLTDAQLQQLVDLCRTLEKIENLRLKDRVEDVQDTLQKVSEAKNSFARFVERLRNIFDAVRSFFDRVSGIVGGEG